MKRWEFMDHTADVGLTAEADSLGELMEALAEGLADVVCVREFVRLREVRRVDVSAGDREALALDFLAAVLNVLQADHFLVASVRVPRATETSLTAELAGEEYDAGRHEIRTEVKAATYHLLKVEKEGQVWKGRVILDL
jgi:SHS2 domain-containing protein